MQEIIVEKPYEFVPPHRGDWVPYFIKKLRLADLYLNYFEGVTSSEVRHLERLQASLSANHGILLAPNHCRYADPLALSPIAVQTGRYLYSMASWHLFNQGRLQAFAIRMVGGFSMNREGVDRASLETAQEILTQAKRPLVVFPEGTVFHTNDRLQPLLDGVSFLTRSAARRREKLGLGKVVIHPVAIKYLYRGDLIATIMPVIKSLEERLTWHEPCSELTILERIHRIGEGLLSLKEVQYLGRAQTGNLAERKQILIQRLLDPLDEAVMGSIQQESLVPRIKQLRSRLVPKLTEGQLPPAEKQKIWKQLSEIYVAQQIEAYPEGYLDEPTETRVLETVERLDEDVHDHARTHRPLHCILEVGEAIEVEPTKPPKGQRDPIMQQLELSLSGMLHRLASESKPFEDRIAPG